MSVPVPVETKKKGQKSLCSGSIKTKHWELKGFILCLVTKQDCQAVKDRALSGCPTSTS